MLKRVLFPLLFPCLLRSEVLQTDLLIVGGDESGCAAAVQAARLGVKRIVVVNDLDWLGGQFCTQGIGPVDEWTIVDDKRTEFPASGLFREMLGLIHAHNRRTYGIAQPGNSWCGSNTIEPRAAAALFEDWLAREGFRASGSERLVLFPWVPVKVEREGERVTAVTFHHVHEPKHEPLRIQAALTLDSTDWGDVIRLSGAGYMAGPDLRARFQEPSAPEQLALAGHQEMNSLTWCPLLRESEGDCTIPKPVRYDERAFADWQKAPPWVEWDGSGGIYNPVGWCIYTHRRMIDRHHLRLAAGTEAVILNWPAHDYPLSTLPAHVVAALEQNEPGASQRNIVDMSLEQRAIVFADAKQRALEFVYWLQTAAHERTGDYPQSFRHMKLADDYGTADRLPPKPYIREGLRLEALYILREQDVRTEIERPLWAKVMVPDGVFGYQFNMDFHPTRRKFVNDDPTQPWQGKHHGTRNWSAHTDRAMFPLRGLVPVKMDGLLGCSKNIGVTSMVQSSLRLHGQMMHVGAASATVAALALREKVQPRAIASSFTHIRDVQRTLVRHGTLIWPWHDVQPEDRHFEAANMLTVAGIWHSDRDRVTFAPQQVVTRPTLVSTLARLVRAMPKAPEWSALLAQPLFSEKQPDEPATWGLLHQWLGALNLPASRALIARRGSEDFAKHPLTRAECVEFLYNVMQARGEQFPSDNAWLHLNADHDGDGRTDHDDPLPFDQNNDSQFDHLERPAAH